MLVSNGATLEGQYEWLETQEDVRDDTREVLGAKVIVMERALHGQADAIADDFNCPPVAKSYERFLGKSVVAGLSDRLKAMDIR